MTITATVLSAAAAAASVYWLILLATGYRYGDQAIQFATLSPHLDDDAWPEVAVIYAARNEAPRVEESTRRFLAQDYPNMQIIAVDDRSTDATGEILDAIADANRRLKVIHVRDLPSGWLGKTHALNVGASLSTAEWILFTDADVMLAPDALRKAIAFAAAQRVAHITAAPSMQTEGFGERAFMALFVLRYLVFAPIWRVHDQRTATFFGVGAFNLVESSALRAVGGFDRLALSVDDDMRLGQALKTAGYSTRVLLADGAVSLRWQIGLAGLIRGMEKNYFAILDFRMSKVLMDGIVLLWLGAGPHLGLFTGPTSVRVLCGVALAVVALLVEFTGRQNRVHGYYALSMPLSAVLCVAALVNSVWMTLWQGGVRWRGHFYPLSELRSHVRVRNSWAREMGKSRPRVGFPQILQGLLSRFAHSMFE